MNGLMFNP